MNTFTAAAAIVLGIGVIMAGASRVGAWSIDGRSALEGSFAVVNGTRMHYVHVAPPAKASLPPVVFIHGASSNFKDEMLPARPRLEGKAEMLFFDRPGYGYSERGKGNDTPYGQAETLAALMDHVGIQKAIIVGHSFGGAVAAAFALRHPEKTAGLVFLSAATHPWPGGGTSWYYNLTATPVVGWLFAGTLAWPAGSLVLDKAVASVFAPNPVPDNYIERASIRLTLRPGTFHANAVDVSGLYDQVKKMAPHYHEIKTPTVIITGDSDDVIYPEVHSGGLARDIAGSKLLWIHNMGHKSDWVAADLVTDAIRYVAGRKVDLEADVKKIDARIADDAAGGSVRMVDKPIIKPKPLSQ